MTIHYLNQTLWCDNDQDDVHVGGKLFVVLFVDDLRFAKIVVVDKNTFNILFLKCKDYTFNYSLLFIFGGYI